MNTGKLKEQIKFNGRKPIVMTTLSRFSMIKKGEFFRFKGKRKVYIFNGGGKHVALNTKPQMI